MKHILVNYNSDPSWVKEYTDDYLIYDRSEDEKWCASLPKEKVIKTQNLGHCDFDKLTYIIDNYYNLPPIFLLGKGNMLERHITKEEFDKIKDAKEFVPILTQHHRTYSDKFGEVCFYKDGIYYERNDNWYINQFPSRIPSFKDWASIFHIPNPDYIPFAPGGCYIVPSERVHRYAKSFYEDIRNTLEYGVTLPGEAQFVERSYYLLWS